MQRVLEVISPLDAYNDYSISGEEWDEKKYEVMTVDVANGPKSMSSRGRFLTVRMAKLNPYLFMFFASANTFSLPENFCRHLLKPSGLEKMKSLKTHAFSVEI